MKKGSVLKDLSNKGREIKNGCKSSPNSETGQPKKMKGISRLSRFSFLVFSSAFLLSLRFAVTQGNPKISRGSAITLDWEVESVPLRGLPFLMRCHQPWTTKYEKGGAKA